MNKLIFQVLKKDKCSNARLGVLTTLHGIVKTPAYVIVATRGEIKTLKPSDIKKTKTQIVISNTYHLWPEAIKIKNLETVKTKQLTINPTSPAKGGIRGASNISVNFLFLLLASCKLFSRSSNLAKRY